MAKKLTEPPSKPSKAGAPPAKTRKPGEACASCGHWSVATEYGVDEKSGYCDRWEKLTDTAYWCPEFISRDQFKQMQDQMAEESEEFLDEEN